jgi:hypothetical protein
MGGLVRVHELKSGDGIEPVSFRPDDGATAKPGQDSQKIWNPRRDAGA